MLSSASAPLAALDGVCSNLGATGPGGRGGQIFFLREVFSVCSTP